MLVFECAHSVREAGLSGKNHRQSLFWTWLAFRSLRKLPASDSKSRINYDIEWGTDRLSLKQGGKIPGVVHFTLTFLMKFEEKYIRCSKAWQKCYTRQNEEVRWDGWMAREEASVA